MFGRVQQYNELKGFGFLLQTQNFRTRVYFHISSWASDEIAPKVGMRVTYDLGPSKKGGMPDQAVNVAPVVVKSTATDADLFLEMMKGSGVKVQS